MKIDVRSLSNETVGDIDLSDAVFGIEPRPDVVQRVVRWQLAKRRAGTHKTKGRSEVHGTTAKPFRQKGTGRARQGSQKAPHMRGGGVAFGPVVRSHAHKLPKKVRALGLKSALSAKLRDGKLIVIDEVKSEDGKTKALKSQFDGLGLSSVLIIGKVFDEGFVRAARNIKHVDLLPAVGANVYDILRRDIVVLTRDAAEMLEERLK